MNTVNILEAKTHLSRLVEDIASGVQRDIIIARNGKPVARLVPLDAQPKLRLGLAKGRYIVPDRIDDESEEMASLFEGES
jgi:antitoxin (DNA-binding transcriptional repressor) of toxin-antitoxin stability system